MDDGEALAAMEVAIPFAVQHGLDLLVGVLRPTTDMCAFDRTVPIVNEQRGWTPSRPISRPYWELTHNHSAKTTLHGWRDCRSP
jgi:hypothetical protein